METLNALLDAEADRLCNAQRYERSEARRNTRAGQNRCRMTEAQKACVRRHPPRAWHQLP
jgi:transposase-like protein